MKASKLVIVGMLAFAIWGVIDLIDESRNEVNQMTSAAVQLPIEGTFPTLTGATRWLNSEPLTPNGLRGKVVLVDFWTYTCINWLRTMPYVRAWAEKYKDQGLVVIGVHTPEFSFEHDFDNVRRASKEMMVDFPIATDNDYAVWQAFDNHYWPALYFIDAQGQIRHHEFGEGNYDESEKIIQQLLTDAGNKNVSSDLVTGEAQGIEVAADWSNLQSGENYVGYDRTEGFASPDRVALDESHVYTASSWLDLNQWALVGDWTVKRPYISLNKANGSIVYNFHARDLHLVMGPATPGTSIRFRVLIDGKAPGAAHGGDVDAQGNGTVSEQRLYQLIRQPYPIVNRQFQIEFLDPGVEAYSFTFG